jgi:hypothetical protein
MGYYYDGKFKISYTEETLVSLALDADNFQQELLNAPWNAFGLDLYTSDNPILSIISELGWELEKTSVEKEIAIVEGFIQSARYNYALDIAMRWLVKRGAGLDVVLDGEDGESWAWRQELGTTIGKKEMIYPILESELDAVNLLRTQIFTLKDYARLIGNSELLTSLETFEEKTKNINKK